MRRPIFRHAGRPATGARLRVRRFSGSWRLRVARSRGGSVHTILQNMRGTEDQDTPGSDRHFLTGLGIATDALSLEPDEETAKGGDLYGLAARQGFRHFIQHRFDKLGRLVTRESDLLVDGLGEMGSGNCVFRHGNSP